MSDDISLVLEAIRIIHQKHKDQTGIGGIIECPECQGRLFYNIAYNGHIWGRCETIGCLSWMM